MPKPRLMARSPIVLPRCPGLIAAVNNADDVAGAGKLQRAVDSLVVSRAGPDSEGWACNAGTGPNGLNSRVGNTQAVHGVADIRCRELGESFKDVPRGAGETGVDVFKDWSCHDGCLPCAVAG